MNAIKNGVLASCIAFMILWALAITVGNGGNQKFWMYGIVICVGLITWSLSGRKKSKSP